MVLELEVKAFLFVNEDEYIEWVFNDGSEMSDTRKHASLDCDCQPLWDGDRIMIG